MIITCMHIHVYVSCVYIFSPPLPISCQWFEDEVEALRHKRREAAREVTTPSSYPNTHSLTHSLIPTLNAHSLIRSSQTKTFTILLTPTHTLTH